MRKVAEQARARKGHGYLMREGLMLFLSDNKAGFWGVSLVGRARKAYQAFVRRDGKTVGLGTFDTPEEAAMCVARSPEGRQGKGGGGREFPPFFARIRRLGVGLTYAVVLYKTRPYLGPT